MMQHRCMMSKIYTILQNRFSSHGMKPGPVSYMNAIALGTFLKNVLQLVMGR